MTGGEAMAALSIRNLDDRVHERLRVRAAEHGRSMESEVRAILEDAVHEHGENDLFSGLIALAEDIGGVELDLAPRASSPRPVELP